MTVPSTVSRLASVLAGDAPFACIESIPIDSIPAAYRLTYDVMRADAQEHGTVDADRILSKANGQAEPLREAFVELLDLAMTESVTTSVNTPIAPPTVECPAPPKESAYYGLAGEIVRVIEPSTESDPVAILTQLIIMYGNLIGRGPYAPVEADRHFTNLFGAIVAVTSKGRKGTSAGQARRPLAEVDEAWSMNRVLGGMSSGEGLIWGVRDPIEKSEPIKKKGLIEGYQTLITDQGETDKRLMVFESEFAGTIRVLGRDGNTLSAIIRQAWDTGHLRILTKNNPARATDAHISIVAHVTKTELLRYLDRTEMGNGFANRFLWIYAKRSKLLPRGGKLVDFSSLTRQLSAAVDFARRLGVRPVTWDDEAGEYWDSIYPRLSAGGVGMAAEVTSRAEAQVLRLSLVYALLDQSPAIRLPHLVAAEALWEYCDASVRFIFGSKLGDPVADDMLAELQKAGPDGRTRNEIRRFFGGNLRSEEIGRALGMLQEQGHVYSRKDECTGGRSAERWFAAIAEPGTTEDGEAWEEGRE